MLQQRKVLCGYDERKPAIHANRSEHETAQEQVAGAESTDRRDTRFGLLGRWRELQGFSWPLVKLLPDGAEYSLAVRLTYRCPLKVLAQTSLGVFIAAAVLLRFGIAEVDVDLGRHGELHMVRRLRSAISS